VIEGAAESMASFFKIAGGWLSDHMRKCKVFVLIGYALSAAVKPLFGVITHWWHALLIQMTDRTGKGIRTAPRDAMIASVSEDGSRGRSFGFHRALDQTGAVLGPLAAAGLLYLFGAAFPLKGATVAPEYIAAIRKTILFAAIPGVLAVVTVVFFVRERKPLHPGAKHLAVSWQGLPVAYRRFVLVMGLFTLANASNAFLILRAKDVGIDLWQLPLLYGLYNLVTVIFSIPGGALSDKVGRKPLLVAALVVYAACYLGFAFAARVWMIWVLFAVYGLFEAFCEPAERALVGDLARDELRGRAYGVFHAVRGAAALPASVLFGWLWDRTGSATVPFLLCAGLALVAAVLLALVVPAHAPSAADKKA